MPVKVLEQYIDLDTAEGGHKLRLYYEWLRDHCRCPSCYSAKTKQRLVDPLTLEAPGAVKPISADLEDEKRALVIHWADGHQSKFAIDWLVDVAPPLRGEPKHEKGLYAQLAKKQVLWNVKSLGKLPSVTYSEFMTPTGLKQLYCDVTRYGVGTVRDCAPTREATKEVIRRMGMVMESAYGQFWDVTNTDREIRPDMLSPGAFAKFVLPTGSSSKPLITHHDNAHYESPAGLRAYQVIEHTDGDGGESLVVDGFNVIKQLRAADPKAFKLLSTTPIPYEKMMDGRHIYNEQPIIRLDPESGEIIQMRYKDPYRGPLSNVTVDLVPDFYDAYTQLTALIRSPENEFRYKLPQGTVIVYDNWRVMHGRGPFTGKRIVHSALLQRDEFWSQARVAGALD